MLLNLDYLNLIEGDCVDKLKTIPDDSVDIIITSPPYAEQRQGKYQGVSEKLYIAWFLPIAQELIRILKSTGSFFLNLKAHCDHGERSLYVMELILKLRNEVGFKYIDEYVWYKSAAPRCKTFRLKNAWEPIYHFSLGNNYINHEEIKRCSHSVFANKRGYTSYNELTGNIGGYHEVADQIQGYTDPDNVLYFPTALLVKDKYSHPAKFPRELALFLIDGFCPPGGVVCDPFLGSGTTALAALIRKCKCIGIELEKKYCDMTIDRIRTYPYNSGKPKKNPLDMYE